MKTFSEKLVLSLIFLPLFLNGCASNFADKNANLNSDANSSQTGNVGSGNSTKDNLEDFRQLVKLPFEPEEVIWLEENEASGTSENSAGAKRKLTAILRFAPSDTEKVSAQAAVYQAGTPANIETETWFPAELIAQSQISGDETVKGISFSAKDFLQPPYINGKLTRIENSDYFVLVLTTF